MKMPVLSVKTRDYYWPIGFCFHNNEFKKNLFEKLDSIKNPKVNSTCMIKMGFQTHFKKEGKKTEESILYSLS